MKKAYAIGSTMVLALLLSQCVFAQGFGGNQPNRQPMQQGMQFRMNASLFATTSPMQLLNSVARNTQLNLTQDQQAQLNQLRMSYNNELTTVPRDDENKLSPSAAHEKAVAELREALLTKDVGDDVIAAKVKACKETEDVVAAINLKYLAQIRNILSAEQLKAASAPPQMRQPAGQGNRSNVPNQPRQNQQNRNTGNRNNNWGYGR